MKSNLRKQKSCQSGFSLVEIVIAAGIISTLLISVAGIAAKSVNVSKRSLNNYKASLLLEEGAEAIRIQRDNSWAGITSLVGSTYYPKFDVSGGNWTFSSSSSDGVVGVFTRSVTVANVNRNASTGDIASSGTADSGTKLVTVTVVWPEGSTTTTKTLQFYTMQIF